jgi:ligand-binding sensor domain-containing protein
VLPFLVIPGALLVGGSVWTSPALADADNPADWSVAIAARAVIDLEVFEGRLWGAVDPGGLLTYDPLTRDFTEVTTVDGLGSNRTRCLAVSPVGELWVGSADAGITRIFPDGRMRFLTALPGQLNVQGIAFSGDNAYYGGPEGGGRIVNGLPERSFKSENGLVNEDVRAVAAREGKAWFGTAGGVSEFDISANDLITRNDGLADLDVRALTVAGGQLYAGTPTALYVLDESNPAAPVWQATTPAINASILDLASHGNTLVVVGTDRRVWSRVDPAAPWTFTQAGSPGQDFFSVTMDSTSRVHLGGRRIDRAPIGNDITPLFADLDGGESSYYRRLYGTDFFGLGTDHRGGVWVGAFPLGEGVSHWTAEGDIISYTAEETGDAIGGFNNDGWLSNLKIDVTEATDGSVWASSTQIGVTRMTPAADGDPAGATYLHLTRDNSPLNMRHVKSIVEDPHGQIWFCASALPNLVIGDFNAGIDVLIDVENPFDPASWISIRASNSFIAGDDILGVAFEGDQVAWITVGGVGVQRFVYGSGTGLDPARLTDESGWRKIVALPESFDPNLADATQLAIGPDGRHWVATDGKGLFSFIYSAGPITSSFVRHYESDKLGSRILSNHVFSVDVDAAGDAWIATRAGLNRVREVDGVGQTSAFTDLQNFLDSGLGEDFSSEILRSLAGGEPVSLQVSGVAPVLYAVTVHGLTRVDLVPAVAPPPDGNEPQFSIYPNPVRQGRDVKVDGFEGIADVEIYDLQGRKLRTTRNAEPGDTVWQLETLSGDPVSNGLYLVRFVQAGGSSLRVLAVER